MNVDREPREEADQTYWEKLQRKGIWHFALWAGSIHFGGPMFVVFGVQRLFLSYWEAIPLWFFFSTSLIIWFIVGFVIGLIFWPVLHVLHDWAERRASRDGRKR